MQWIARFWTDKKRNGTVNLGALISVVAFFPLSISVAGGKSSSPEMSSTAMGYCNYRCCYCQTSQAELAAFGKQHPELSSNEALNQFSLETLVNFNNRLSAYVREVKPDARVISHVYPVYLPDPLYGNRLDLDVCAQTAAWFFEPFWSTDKIAQYSGVIAGKAKQYHDRPRGAALVGYFNMPDKWPVKSGQRLTAEIQAILDGGCSRVHVCSFNDVLNTPEATDVFRSFFRRPDRQQTATEREPL